jgi:hypothetical protein
MHWSMATFALATPDGSRLPQRGHHCRIATLKPLATGAMKSP